MPAIFLVCYCFWLNDLGCDISDDLIFFSPFREGTQSMNPLLVKLCPQDGLRSVYSTSNDAYVHFISDGSGTSSDFELHWEQITGKFFLT